MQADKKGKFEALKADIFRVKLRREANDA